VASPLCGVLTLALGIAAPIQPIFSMVNALLLQPPKFPQSCGAGSRVWEDRGIDEATTQYRGGQRGGALRRRQTVYVEG